jgi:hypothetical protein
VSDTDDRLMLLATSMMLAKSALSGSVTIVLSARKKANDATTPEDVAQWMRARLVELGVVPTVVSPTELRVGATRVLVFQQHSQRTASPETKLDALDDGAMLAELAEANGALLAHLAQALLPALGRVLRHAALLRSEHGATLGAQARSARAPRPRGSRRQRAARKRRPLRTDRRTSAEAAPAARRTQMGQQQ